VDVTPSLNEAINQVILQNGHSTKADFLRDAIKRRLEEMGYTRNFSIKTFQPLFSKHTVGRVGR